MAEVGCLSVTVSSMAFISFVLVIISLCPCKAHVPLIIWTSEGDSLPTLTEPAAGEIVSGMKLVSSLQSALTTLPNTVLLFLQDKLSLEDFTVYGGVFGNKQDSVFLHLESALQASTPLVLPALALSTTDSVEELFQEVLGIPALHIVPSALNQLQLNTSQPSFLVISLPYTHGVQSKELLRKNDEIIGDVLTVFTAHGVPYTAVYTGLMPSYVTHDTVTSLTQRFVGRSLLQARRDPTVKPPVTFNSTLGQPCILLWADHLNISHVKGPWFDLGPFTFINSVSLDGSFCNETFSRLVLNYQNVLSFKSFQLTFLMRKIFFPVSARNWTVIEKVELNYDGQRAVFNSSRGIYSPAEFSFHCQSVSSSESPLLVPSNAKDNASQWNILFTDFQIQGFNVTGNFSYASDCASFFTPGIWMGLLTSLLMVLILTYGLHMIMQLRTMDRFDDPKGPGISVPLND
ncbi:V-type proton ATPase subunit S1b isoform X1 [Electrophorus electricus]|uniref:ATPase H+ transporting accessory protein 1a n=1 Tax=Electrophorus electricus TaxID=8005 RepID=A0A4W4HPJ1_ELEEL|nr:V-type proton ATPase subunit S1b isoform X1 [Electrophorus electricus]